MPASIETEHLISALYYSGNTFTALTQPDGTSSYTVAVVDAAGNATAQSAALSVTVVTASPATPPAPALQPGSDSGSSSNDGITNITAPTFNITSTAAYFRVYVNGALMSGNYQAGSTFTLPSEADGTYQVTVAAVDAAGNISSASPATPITIDTTAPIVTANSLATTDTAPPLSGAINDAAATVRITVNGNSYSAINNGNGTWSLPDNTIIPPLSSGTYVVSVSATDLAGNIGTGSANLTIAPVLFVDASATGLNNGSSWVNAYTTLSAALAHLSGPGVIDVARGTYEAHHRLRSHGLVCAEQRRRDLRRICGRYFGHSRSSQCIALSDHSLWQHRRFRQRR